MALFDFTSLPIDENYKPIPNTYRNWQSGNQKVTVPGTAVKLISAATECKKVDVTANTNNVDIITIGGSGVVGALVGRKGIPVTPGNTYTFYITDISNVYVDSVQANDGCSFNYFW